VLGISLQVVRSLTAMPSPARQNLGDYARTWGHGWREHTAKPYRPSSHCSPVREWVRQSDAPSGPGRPRSVLTTWIPTPLHP
jgi:hypothetical protein